MTRGAQLPDRRHDRQPGLGDVKWLPLLLIPVVCCALPALLVAVAAASAAALGAGIAVVAVLVLAAGVLVARYRRRCRTEQCAAETTATREARA